MNVTLCLTHACNLRCTYCYAGRKEARRMTWEVARQAIDFALQQTLGEVRTLGLPAAAQLSYFGGEPLLEWDLLTRSFEYALARAHEQGLSLQPTLTTNLTLLDEDKAGWLKQNGFTVGLSIDGHAAMHNRLRRFANGRGSHAAALKGLMNWKASGAAGEVILVVDPRTVEHLAPSVQWLIELGLAEISLNPNFYTHWSDDALEVWRQQSEAVGDLYIGRYRLNQPVKINVIDGKIKVRLTEGYASCDHCGFGNREIAVAASGAIYPCERVVGDDDGGALCIGDVFRGFDPARRTRILAERTNLESECRDCPLQDRCMNWCACINVATSGAINRVAGIVCHHEKMVIGVADRVGTTLFAERNPAFLARFYGG